MENTPNRQDEAVIELGRVSVETKGPLSDQHVDSIGGFAAGGLSDD